MMTSSTFHSILGVVFSVALLSPLGLRAQSETSTPSEFSKPVVDIGIVVADLEKSATFYTKVLGLTEVPGFSVTAEKTAAFGLTDHQPATIRVFTLDKDAPGTRIKLMAFPERPGVKPDQTFIHSTIGISYLTFNVTNLSQTLQRLSEAGVKLLGQTPADLGGNKRLVAIHDPDGNFIELIGTISDTAK